MKNDSATLDGEAGAAEKNGSAPSGAPNAAEYALPTAGQPNGDRLGWGDGMKPERVGYTPLPKDAETGTPRVFTNPQLYLSPSRLALLEKELAQYKPEFTAQIELVVQDLIRAADGMRAYRETIAGITEDQRLRRTRASKAREKYLKRAGEIDKFRAAAAEPLVKKLDELDEEIGALDMQISDLATLCLENQPIEDPTRFASSPHVPEAARRAEEHLLKEIADKRGEVQELRTEHKRRVEEAEQAASRAARHDPAANDPEAGDYRYPPIVWAAEAFLGIPLGLALGVGQGWVDRVGLKMLKPVPMVWGTLFAGTGCAVIFLITTGMSRLWSWAGYRSLSDDAGVAPPARWFRWSTARNTIVPAGITAVLIACEAAVLRNIRISSALIKDPGNILYFLDAMPFVLPATIVGAMQGWKRGVREYKSEQAEATAQEKADAKTAQAEQTAPIQADRTSQEAHNTTAAWSEATAWPWQNGSPKDPVYEAYPLVRNKAYTDQKPDTSPDSAVAAHTWKLERLRALAARGAMLADRRAQIVADIKEARQPGEELLARYTAELDFDSTLTEAELRQIVTAEVTAFTASEQARQSLERLVDAINPRLRPEDTVPAAQHTTVILNQTNLGGLKDGTAAEAKATPAPARLSWRDRMKAFFGGMKKRLPRRRRSV